MMSAHQLVFNGKNIMFTETRKALNILFILLKLYIINVKINREQCLDDTNVNVFRYNNYLHVRKVTVIFLILSIMG